MAVESHISINSSRNNNHRLISDLPLHIFENLVSSPRCSIAKSIIDDESVSSTLRLHILSKLRLGSNNTSGGSHAILTLRDLLNISPPTLMRILDPCLTYVECNRFLSRVYDECASRPQSAFELMHRDNTPSHRRQNHQFIRARKIPTGLETLDSCLLGGIPTGSITEIVGRAGVGKTHLAQQLATSAAYVDGGTIYIDAEKKLSLTRLREIAFERSHIFNKGDNSVQQPLGVALAQQVLENVTIHSIRTTSELLDILDRLEDDIILLNAEATKHVACDNASVVRFPVRLIIIDSIAAPLRRDFDMVGSTSSSRTAARRATAIFQISKRLKQLAHDYQLAVGVINQVGSGNISKSNGGEVYNQRNSNLDINDGEFSASLGTAWQYCVSTRIVLKHDNDPHSLQSDGLNDTTRSTCTAALVKSLVSRRTKLSYELTKQGLCEVLQTDAEEACNFT